MIFKYYIYLEGNLYWEKEVFAKCEIIVGDNEMSANGVLTFSSDDAKKEGELFTKVAASYKP